MAEIDYLSNFEAFEEQKPGLFGLAEITSPAEETLPHRGTPYLGKAPNILDSMFGTVEKSQEINEPKYNSDDLEIRAELMVGLLMTKFSLYIGLAKGGISELVVNDRDIEILRNHQHSGLPDNPEITEIRERIQIKEKLEKTPTSDMNLKKDILKKAVKLDLERKLKAGTLPELSVERMILMMVSSEFSVLIGNNFGVFSTIGKNIIKKAKGFF